MLKERELIFDRNCHVIYSKQLRKKIIEKITLHYPEDKMEEIFTKFQLQFVDFLKDYRTDLGGKKNFHNGVCGTYDCIAVFAYYIVCKDVTSFEEIESLYGDLFIDFFKKLSFVDCNKDFYLRLMHKAFLKAEKRCEKWKDYNMQVEPFKKGEPIRYRFTACPVAEFAKEHNLIDILPALCNADYAAMEVIHARLVRTTTLGVGEYCDYTICGDKDSFLNNHEEFRDENGGRCNK